MNVWTITPRCSGCHARQTGLKPRDHKFSCSWWSFPYSSFGIKLPKRDPGRSIHQPWLAKWPKEWRREKK